MSRQKPCHDCGGEKQPIRGTRYCEACRDRRRVIWERDSYQRKLERRRDGRPSTRLPRAPGPAPDGMVWCARCQLFLPRADFRPNRTRKNGLGNYCADCSSAVSHEARLKRVYNVTPAEYEALLRLQDGRCFICETKPRSRRLAVDHDHKTGLIRGLLCKRCNQSLLGAAHESPDLLRRAASYLENPPAPGAGVRSHVSTWASGPVDLRQLTPTQSYSVLAGLPTVSPDLREAVKKAELRISGPSETWIAVLREPANLPSEWQVAIPAGLLAELLDAWDKRGTTP